MKVRVPILLFALGCFPVSGVFLRADSITLKDGRKIEGEILSNGPDGVLVEYYITPTIKDQKSLSQDEILKIESIPIDEKAYKAIGSLATPDTVLDTSFYDLLIERKIPEFQARFRYSKHLSELREDLRSLEAERSRVRKGDRRIDGVWITAEQIAADPYQTGAKVRLTEMKESIAAGDPVASLQTYEMIEKDFPGASVIPVAVKLALGQIDLLQEKLNTAKANFLIIDKRRQNALTIAMGDNGLADQAKEIKGALEKEKTASKLAIDTATANGTKFFPIFQNTKESMDMLQTLITSEKLRLTALDKIPIKEGMAAAGQCSRLLAEGKAKEAQDQLTQSMTLWPANIENAHLKQQVDDLVKSQAASAAAAAAAAAAPKKPTPTPAPPAPTVKP
jgi:hypothetical protein